ncbi:MAG: hypothetical protein HZA22_00340 [Nitrospirae bacterium]|nr:hypothetical protein [Nitrospirota bacterium]MBI5694405.1 hypothetical protein [Nitrospirota bacterium]
MKIFTAMLMICAAFCPAAAGAEMAGISPAQAQALYLNASGGDRASGYVGVDNPASGFISQDPAGVDWVLQPRLDGTSRWTRYTDMPSAVGTFAATAAFRDIRGALPATLTRNTTRTYIEAGTGLLKTASVNAPAVEAQGISIEKAVTNYLLKSNALSVSPWVAGTGLNALVANQDAARDGTMTATKLVPATTTGSLYQVINGVSVQNRTFNFAVDLRADTPHTAKLRLENKDANPVEYAEASVSVTAALTRFNVPLACAQASTSKLLVRIYPDSGAGTEHVYASSATVSETRVPFSYIPTDTVAATKSLDALSVANNGVLADASGTLLMTYSPLSASTEVVTNTIIAGPGSGILYRDGANIKSDDGTSILVLPATWTAGQPLRLALTWDASGRRLYNLTAGTSQSGAYDGSFGIGQSINFYSGASAPNGSLKDVKFWTRKLSDTEVSSWQ